MFVCSQLLNQTYDKYCPPRFFANIAITFAARLVWEETVKTGVCHESVRKQEVLASKKTCSYWWKKAPHQLITKLYDKQHDLVAEEQGKSWEGQRRKSDSSSDSDRDGEF